MKKPNEHIQLYYVKEGNFNDNSREFVKTPGTHPVATIALAWVMPINGLTLRQTVIARGIAICSKDDQFSRATGRKVAIKRARQALYTGKSSLVISQGSASDHFFDCLTEQFPGCDEIEFEDAFTMLSGACVKLAPHEDKLIDIYMDKFLHGRTDLTKSSKTTASTSSVYMDKPLCAKENVTKLSKTGESASTRAVKAVKAMVKKAEAKAQG